MIIEWIVIHGIALIGLEISIIYFIVLWKNKKVRKTQ